ncbi:hypothetical protein L9F63_019796, partial [Diploptera punctata]
QPLGILVAETNRLALKAVSKVKVEYSGVTKPHTDMQDIINFKDRSRVKVYISANSARADTSDVTHVVKGSFCSGMQYHFTLETQQCICIPVEDGFDVFPSTQYPALTEIAISQFIKIVSHTCMSRIININVRRLGGGFGVKLIRSAQVASACAIAAHHVNGPVRFLMSLETNMEAIGMRCGARIDYEKLQIDEAVEIDIYEDAGISWNEKYATGTLSGFKNCYESSDWKINVLGVRTDIPTTTWCRGPGSTEGIAGIEHIMEHIAKTVNKDPTQVRLLNMNKNMSSIPQLITDLKINADYNIRKESIDNFNKNNRWVKKGISLVPMAFEVVPFDRYYAMVSIYGPDGSVAIVHGGIECGQGINTKVAQTAAHVLGCSLELVSVKSTNNLITPNNQMTGASITSEASCYSVNECCKELLKRMAPVKKSMKNPSWSELVQKSVEDSINLNTSHMYPYGDVQTKNYYSYGIAITEIELDVLTGRNQICRVDILEDAGKSENPEIDIGQVEGGFIMGLGLWRQEQIIYDPYTGRNLTNRTWNYTPPVSKDIPIDFRIELRKDSPNPFGFTRAKSSTTYQISGWDWESSGTECGPLRRAQRAGGVYMESNTGPNGPNTSFLHIRKRTLNKENKVAFMGNQRDFRVENRENEQRA